MSRHQDTTVTSTVLHHGNTAHLTLPGVPHTGPAHISIARSVGVVTSGVEGCEVLGCEGHHQVVSGQAWPGAVIITTHRVQSLGSVQDGSVIASAEVREGGGAGGHHNAGQLEFYRRVRERAVPDERVKRGSSLYSMYSLYSQSPEVDGVEVGDDVAPGGSETEVKPLVETVVDHDEYLRVDGARVVLPALPPPGHIEAVRESLVVS